MGYFLDKPYHSNDTTIGSNSNDILTWSNGSDFIDAGGGLDTLSINENREFFEINQMESGITYVNGLNPPEWLTREPSLVMSNTEKVEFLDNKIKIKNTYLFSGSLILDRLWHSNDTLLGTSGDDVIAWRNGSDFVNGGKGEDILSINARSDLFDIQEMESGVVYINGIGLDEAEIEYDPRSGLPLTGNPWKGLSLTASNVEKIEFLDTTIALQAEENAVIADKQATPNRSIKKDNSSNFTEKSSYNEIDGTTSNDQLIGSRRSDYLWGDRGDDDLFGGKGNDLIIGGKGYDTLYGGKGKDIFGVGKKHGKGKRNFDVITDFEIGIDSIWVEGSQKGLWLLEGQGHAFIMRGAKDVIALVENAGNQIDWTDSGPWEGGWIM